MRSARRIIRSTLRIYMTSQSSGRNPRRSRSGGGSRRRGDDRSHRPRPVTKAPVKMTLWEKFLGFFSGNGSPPIARVPQQPKRNGDRPERSSQSRKVESVEVTTPRLYVGN